jgi:hypothetical protein
MAGWRVEGGKVIQEMSEDKLDVVIERITKRVQGITEQISELKKERDRLQLRLGKVTQLKGELTP